MRKTLSELQLGPRSTLIMLRSPSSHRWLKTLLCSPCSAVAYKWHSVSTNYSGRKEDRNTPPTQSPSTQFGDIRFLCPCLCVYESKEDPRVSKLTPRKSAAHAIYDLGFECYNLGFEHRLRYMMSVTKKKCLEKEN